MSGDVLAAHAGAHPDKPAIIDDRPGADVVTFTFAELDGRANQLAHVLLESGARPGTKVLTWGQNSSGLLVAAHAVRRIGAVAVPLNYRLTARGGRLRGRQLRRRRRLRRRRVRRCPRSDPGVTSPRSAEVLVFDGDGELEARLDGGVDRAARGGGHRAAPPP